MRTIRNCNVVVLGGAGFLGSHCVNHLIDDRECRVLVIDNLVAGRREFIHPKAEFHHHDITGSEDHLCKLFVAFGAKYVMNWVAYPYVPDSFSRPLHVFNVNAMGAIKVINAAQEAGCEGILQVSSAELYGDDGHREYQDGTRTDADDELTPVQPHSTYGAAKAAVDYYCQTAWRERKTPVIALRQFNCVGECETHPYVVPEIISQLSVQTNAAMCTECYTVRTMSNPPCARCNGSFIDPDYSATVKLGNNSFRDFLYAGDAVRIAVELLERGEFGEVYNSGSETGIKIYDLAKLVGKVMGFADVRVERDESRVRPWEIWHLQSDNTKLWNKIGRRATYHFEKYSSRPSVKSVGFEPGEVQYLGVDVEQLTPLEEALRRTVKWFEENGRKWPWSN